MIDWNGSRLAALNGSYILTFDSYLGSQGAQLMANEVATRLGIHLTESQAIGRGKYAEFTTSDPINPAAALQLTQNLPHLKFFEPNQVFDTARVPNDPNFGIQWGLANTGQTIQGNLGTIGADIHAQQAWDLSIGSRNVVVADIDTGIDLTHPDLIPNLWTNPGEIPGNGIDDDGDGFVDDVHGYDFGTQVGSPQDQVGHGTETAGVIGAAGNNALGVTGVNWNVSIMALKIADAQGRLSTAAIIGAQDYATLMRTRGINIVVSNNSYGAFAPTFYANSPNGIGAERDAIQAFINSGATFVASAGNNAANNDLGTANYPASYLIPGMISVAATDNNDALAAFSAYGPQTVTIGAPGVGIVTTQMGGGYTVNGVDGTSFSGPMVAGAVALMQAYWESTHNGQNASAVQIREALVDSADPLPALEGKVVAGGRLNIARALQILGVAGPTLSAAVPGPVVGQINPSTNQPFNTVALTFSHDIDAAALSSSDVHLIGAGADGLFNTADDRIIPVTTVTLSPTSTRTVVVALNLSGFAQQRLPIDKYQLTLDPAGFKDTSGNFLNGNTAAGTPEVYAFRVVPATGDNEPNDTLATATSVLFDASGSANFSGATIGNGVNANLDVDIYRIDMARGGLITAEITAKRLASPSSLDSYLRLFDANGNEIASNDQAFGSDSFLDFFVTTGGTYYIGVSGFGNEHYDPTVAASGTSQSLGTYSLKMSVALNNNDVVSYDSSTGTPTLPLPIPQAGGGQTQGTTTAFINIPDTRQIVDVNVNFDITHSFDGDLKISLIGPDGTTVLLVNRRGNNGQNFTSTIMDDEGAVSITTAAAPFTGVFRPEQALGAFDGKTAAGRWTIMIQDVAALNSGFLNSWSLTFTLKNDIFGPFESNDTLTTAKNLNEINGTGTATRTAVIGDGGFGSFDRDIFSFTADAGSSLSVTVNSATLLNSAIRLFDSTGTQVLVNNPDGTLNSSIDNYVFANGGVYYLAVSEANNVAYDPRVVGSGNAALTTGGYTMTVTLAAGVSDPATVLTGGNVSVGVNPNGTYAANDSNGQNVGLKFDNVEFLPTQGSGQMFFGALASGSSFANSGAAAPGGLPFALTTTSDTFNNRIATKASFNGLNIQRTFAYGVNDSFVAIDVYFTNGTSSTITNLGWMEGFNPDPGISLSEANRNTANDVDATGKMASAVYTNNAFLNGLTIALAAPASDDRAKATVIDSNQTVRDPSILIGQAPTDPDGTVSDGQLALSFDMGNLSAGASTHIRYFIFFGTSPDAVNTMFAAVNNGTGTGHLTADPANPASEPLDTGSLPAASVPTLPYRVFYPEGFYGDNIFTFLPISNMSDQPASVYVIAHYETGDRDQLVGHLNIGANARSGLTLVTPQLFEQRNTPNVDHPLVGRPDVNGQPDTVPYALEIRSDRPVAAMFSHYDLTHLTRDGNPQDGHSGGVGESFTSVLDTNWTFGQVSKGTGIADFLVFYNPTDTLTKVTASYIPFGGGAPVTETFNLAPHRRGGFAVNDAPGLVDGDYGVNLTSDVPIVAALSHYDFNQLNAEGTLGNTGAGATTGVVPEGQQGLNSTTDSIGVLNAGQTAATVVFSFIFQNGSAYRTSLDVAPGSHNSLTIASLPNFPTGQPYGVFYESNTPVSVQYEAKAFNNAEFSATASQAYTMWGFGEGYRPGDTQGHPGIVETLRLYNPSETATTVEITIGYDGLPGSETFRRTLAPRTITEFNMDQFITGARRATQQWYGTTIKAATPIVAYMDHYDKSFNGPADISAGIDKGTAFGTLGTPIGRVTVVT